VSGAFERPKKPGNEIMTMLDAQTLTLVEAVVLVLLNAAGGLLTALAWRVSDVDVREAVAWQPSADEPAEVFRRRHNRLVVTEDARYGESRRFAAHLLIAVIAVFWIVAPQPTNPDVIGWAVVIRFAAVLLSLTLIDKTLHHLIARWRFDRPAIARPHIVYLWPALTLAWRDVQGGRP
jgi:hypothetical protein